MKLLHAIPFTRTDRRQGNLCSAPTQTAALDRFSRTVFQAGYQGPWIELDRTPSQLGTFLLRLQTMRTFFRLMTRSSKRRKCRQIRKNPISYKRCCACSPPSFLLIFATEYIHIFEL
jgi:hypothetical protein